MGIPICRFNNEFDRMFHGMFCRYLDLHDDGALVRGMEGTYGPEIFRGKVGEPQ